MEINGKAVIYGILIVLILLLLLVSLGVLNINPGKSTGAITGGDYNNMPEKCRPPSGQDLNAWKEHLGHHADTQECLNYFN